MKLEQYFSLLSAMRRRRTVPGIVEYTGISIASVYRYVKEIEQLGLASPIQPEGKKKRNTQWLLTIKGRAIVNAWERE